MVIISKLKSDVSDEFKWESIKICYFMVCKNVLKLFVPVA